MITVLCTACSKVEQYPDTLLGQSIRCQCGKAIKIAEMQDLATDAVTSFDGFLGMFYHELVDVPLYNQNTLNLYMLRIENNDFSYLQLTEVLRDVLVPYVLSKNTRKEYANRIGTLSKRAREKFRAYWQENKKAKKADREGELGELLLYAFLEAHLGAPKILSKYEIKTANNDYVKGADGVHLLKLTDTDYQLVFGESKLYKTLEEGIEAAFKSISKFLVNKKDGYEMHLVDTQLLKEAYSPGLYKKLKEILIPRESKVEYNLDRAFGLFVGFDYNIDEQTRKCPNSSARVLIRKAVVDVVTQGLKTLNNKLNKPMLHGYSFYVYVMPFSDLANKRRDVIGEVIS